MTSTHRKKSQQNILFDNGKAGDYVDGIEKDLSCDFNNLSVEATEETNFELKNLEKLLPRVLENLAVNDQKDVFM